MQGMQGMPGLPQGFPQQMPIQQQGAPRYAPPLRFATLIPPSVAPDHPHAGARSPLHNQQSLIHHSPSRPPSPLTNPHDPPAPPSSQSALARGAREDVAARAVAGMDNQCARSPTCHPLHPVPRAAKNWGLGGVGTRCPLSPAAQTAEVVARACVRTVRRVLLLSAAPRPVRANAVLAGQVATMISHLPGGPRSWHATRGCTTMASRRAYDRANWLAAARLPPEGLLPTASGGSAGASVPALAIATAPTCGSQPVCVVGRCEDALGSLGPFSTQSRWAIQLNLSGV